MIAINSVFKQLGVKDKGKQLAAANFHMDGNKVPSAYPQNYSKICSGTDAENTEKTIKTTANE